MPYKPKRPCSYPSCPQLTHKSYCAQHSGLWQQNRGSSSKRGYDHRWQAIRKMYLAENPLCVECLRKGRLVEATEVHHITTIRDGGTNDYSNLMALCKGCHSKITIKWKPEYTYKKMRGQGASNSYKTYMFRPCGPFVRKNLFSNGGNGGQHLKAP